MTEWTTKEYIAMATAEERRIEAERIYIKHHSKRFLRRLRQGKIRYDGRTIKKGSVA